MLNSRRYSAYANRARLVRANYMCWPPSAPGGEWSIVDSLAADTCAYFASINSALSTSAAKSFDLPRLARPLALLLSSVASIGCWEEIRYEPAPQGVQSPAAEPDAPPRETEGNPGAEAIADSGEPTTAEPAPATKPVTQLATPPLDSPPLKLAQPPSPETAASTDALAATPAQRQLIWQAASKWSLAAAMFAKQLPPERLEPMQKEANDAAAELGVVLPSLPTPAGAETPEQAVVATLSGETTASLVAATTKRFGPAAGSLADLAIRTNLLLLTYSPRRDDVAAQATRLRSVAEGSGLPSDVWTPVMKLLDERGEYVAVRTAIFDLHRRVETLLAEASR